MHTVVKTSNNTWWQKPLAYCVGGPRISVRVVTIKPNILASSPTLVVKHRQFSPALASAIALLAFVVGAVAMWQTGSIRALAPNRDVYIETTPAGAVPFRADNRTLGPLNSLPSEVLYTLTLEQLEQYLREGYKSPETKQKETEARMLAERKAKLIAYLQSKGSPLASIADTLTSLQHWRLVLAIANSESSLGKRCYTNNCSGIGVAPGHPLWQEYATKADWAKALDRLIERRYKGWTLKDMNGVYNQPGSENWIFAATQVLNDLQGIE